jgi:hypothetical protein
MGRELITALDLLPDALADRLHGGDLCWYRQNTMGGYGWFSRWIPGRWVRYAPRRGVMDVIRRDGELSRIAVDPRNVRRRDPSPETWTGGRP